MPQKGQNIAAVPPSTTVPVGELMNSVSNIHRSFKNKEDPSFQ